MTQDAPSAPRKPRIAIMGEFSAGKSTLCNLILGARPLPEKVTATRLSPIWMSKGTDGHHRVLLDGTTQPVMLENLQDIAIEDTRVIRLFFDADLLDFCDIIDFPGISDPNMDSEVWERVLVEADAVLWLTHATQAWRQTEAAVWENVPEHVRANSALLVTRFDKLVTEQDKTRVLARLRKETDGQFAEIFPISLTQALEGRNDFKLWQSSGAAAFSEHLVALVQRLSSDQPSPARTAETPTVADTIADSDNVTQFVAAAMVEPQPQADRVMPRRVRVDSELRRARAGRRSKARSN